MNLKSYSPTFSSFLFLFLQTLLVKDDSSGSNKIIGFDTEEENFVTGGSEEGKEREENRGSDRWERGGVHDGLLLLSLYSHGAACFGPL